MRGLAKTEVSARGKSGLDKKKQNIKTKEDCELAEQRDQREEKRSGSRKKRCDVRNRTSQVTFDLSR